jgi:adenylosuccinate synthase
VRDTAYFLQDLLAQGKSLLFEGANGTLLDVDHGTYPFVTSSNTGVAGIFPGTGLPPAVLGRVVGIVKAYSTRVGSGPMPTELKDQTAEIIRTRGNEFGTTTGRPRRVGWLDLVAVKYSAMINGSTELAVMLADVLGAGSGLKRLKVCVGYRLDGVVSDRFPADAADLERVEPVYTELEGFEREIGECRSFDELPPAARAYIGFIETYTGVPVRLVSVGPGREQTIVR